MEVAKHEEEFATSQDVHSWGGPEGPWGVDDDIYESDDPSAQDVDHMHSAWGDDVLATAQRLASLLDRATDRLNQTDPNKERVVR